MSVGASEGALLDSNDKGLPDVMPLQSNPQDEADSKLAMMLARAVSIGLKVSPPPCQERSRLDDCFLGPSAFFLGSAWQALQGTLLSPSLRTPQSCASVYLGTVKPVISLMPLNRSLGAWLALPTPLRWLRKTITLSYAI